MLFILMQDFSLFIPQFNVLEAVCEWWKIVSSSSTFGHCLEGKLHDVDPSPEVICVYTDIYIAEKAFLNMKTNVQTCHLIFHM